MFGTSLVDLMGKDCKDVPAVVTVICEELEARNGTAGGHLMMKRARH